MSTKTEIVYKKINELIPYEKNPRKNEKAVEYVANSIKRFGFKVPIVIDSNNIIVTGHTRLKACKELGINEVPCIIADDLTEQEINAFRLADNSVSEQSKWDNELLLEELTNLDINFDMSEFDLNIWDFIKEDKENERHRTNDAYNLDLVDFDNSSNDFWQMPEIQRENIIPDNLIDLNVMNVEKNCKTKGVTVESTGIHCFVDDYKLERLWNKPQDYIEVLKQYQCALTPDFSLYMDMPMPMKIWNIYRSRQIGQYWQKQGIKVIPTISWAEEDTFKFCFKGIPKGSIVAVSTIGVKRNKDAMIIWKNGMDAMIQEIEPSTILVYGGKLDYDYGNIEVVYYKNKVTERLKEV